MTKRLSQKQLENLQRHNENQRAQREARRAKSCSWCNRNFYDVSNRLTQSTCSKTCSRTLGVATRQQKGSYKRTKEQNKKMVASMQNLRKEGKAVISVEAKAKLSKLLKERWSSGKMHNDSKATCLIKYGVDHWMKTEQGKAHTRKLHTGKVVSVETRKKMSLNSRKQTHRFSKCRGGFREDLEMYFRSSWEANYARLLNQQGVAWEYEKDTFELSSGGSYTPDFKIDTNEYIEIKGWLTSKAKEKLKLFKSEYPHVNLQLIQRNEYRKLYKEYSEKIPFWEMIGT